MTVKELHDATMGHPDNAEVRVNGAPVERLLWEQGYMILVGKATDGITIEFGGKAWSFPNWDAARKFGFYKE